MTILPEKTVSLQVGDGVFVDVSIQLKASSPTVPKPRPNPRRLAELVLDIGDPSSAAPPVQAALRVDLKYEA